MAPDQPTPEESSHVMDQDIKLVAMKKELFILLVMLVLASDSISGGYRGVRWEVNSADAEEFYRQQEKERMTIQEFRYQYCNCRRGLFAIRKVVLRTHSTEEEASSNQRILGLSRADA